jgi:hypothetical protein
VERLSESRNNFLSSVQDPDTYVFGPPGFASVSVIYLYGSGSGSGSGSFHQQAKKKLRKTLMYTVFGLFMALYL